MNCNNHYVTSYAAAHRFIPPIAFESNVSSLDTGKEWAPNDPNLKQWIYDTSTSINYNLKFDTTDPMHRPTKVNFDKTNYMTSQFEKYWSNPPKPMDIPPTEYNEKYVQPKLMSNINQTPASMNCVQPKLVAPKEVVTMHRPKISDIGVIRKMDPYATTQKLAYIEINPIVDKEINCRQPKRKQTTLEYEPFYNEPIFNRKDAIRLLPTTLKHVPYNALKSETSVAYKIPINKLSKFDGTVEMPISTSRNPTLLQIFSVPGMYTSEYSNIGGHK